MSATNFNTRNEPFRKLIGNGLSYQMQSPQTGWQAFSEDEVEALTHRLGNMTLMQAGANRTLGNADYVTKRAVLQASGFAITQKIATDNAEWTPERIAAHQNWMANQAASIWRIAQLS